VDERNVEPYWLDEKDWLCCIEFLPKDDPESRGYGADAVGYLVEYAQVTDTRILALVGDPDAEAYEILFSFSSPENKNLFLDLARSNEEMGDSYVDEELTVPTIDEIKRARSLAMVLPDDVVGHTTLISTTLMAGREGDGAPYAN